MIEAPSCEDLFNEDGLEQVDEKTAPWRHGLWYYTVFRRQSDDTFWQAIYQVSSDCETHGLRDNEAEIFQVLPREVTVTEYHRGS